MIVYLVRLFLRGRPFTSSSSSKYGVNLQEISNPFFLGKDKKCISKCCIQKYLPRMLSVN